MPAVTVNLIAGRTPEQKKNAALAITEAIMEHLDVSIEAVTVNFIDYEATDWMSGGKTMAEKRAAKG
jgi:4-oxalocrotonate tautomerase